MAIAVNGGHVSRAIDFFEKEGKYFVIGGSNSKMWDNEPSPDLPVVGDFKLRDIIGFKRVDNTFLVVPASAEDTRASIAYRNQKWRVVQKEINTVVGTGGVANGSPIVPVASVESLTTGAKIRIDNEYEGTIQSISGNNLTLDTAAPRSIAAGSPVLAGALVEGAKYVYVEGYLEYDQFPLQTYRQIGLCSGVVAKDSNNANVLKAAAFSTSEEDEFSSVGILEILDNRAPIPRDITMRELISMIIEF